VAERALKTLTNIKEMALESKKMEVDKVLAELKEALDAQVLALLALLALLVQKYKYRQGAALQARGARWYGRDGGCRGVLSLLALLVQKCKY
jgi:hypothetical protein